MADETTNNINLDLEFEKIVPWNGQNDTGQDVRLKLDRNWQRVVDAFNFVLSGLATDARYLRKDIDDRSAGKIASDVGFEGGTFVIGATGMGIYQDADGNWHIESDFMKVRKKFTATSVEIQDVHHIGGQMLLSAADMIAVAVVERDTAYRCYFRKTDTDGRTVNNKWLVNDQAYCCTFNLETKADGTTGNHYFWRLVSATSNETTDDVDTLVIDGESYPTSDFHFIDLSKSLCGAGSGVPFVGNEIVHLGYQGDDNPDRQTAILLAGAGEGAPYLYLFTGIDSFTLPEPETRLKPGDNVLTGRVHIKEGSTGASNMTDLPDEVYKAVHVGAVNLLLNTGFTGDYRSEDLAASSDLTSVSELFSKALKHWNGSATVSDDTSAVSGRCAVIGSLAQSVQLLAGESYVVSFKAKGTDVKVMLGGDFVEQALTSDYVRHAFKFVSDGVGTFSISGTATICDLQLERGTIATDWNPSPNDNDKTLAEFQSLKYIQDAIVNGSTDILGGLILTSMLKLGNYKDGVMQKVNAGVSGIYNDDNDVAFWGGGTLEEAIKTVIKFKENPRYRPTDADWLQLANFVVSHGGDAFFKGYVYALGGFFRGAVEIANGKVMLNDDGSGHLADGAIRWETNGLMYRKAADMLVWTHISECANNTVDYNLGNFFDLSLQLNSTVYYHLPDAPVSGYRICISMKRWMGIGSAILTGLFKVYNPSTGSSASAYSLKIYQWSAFEFWLEYRVENGTAYWLVSAEKYTVSSDMVIIGIDQVIVVESGDSDSRSVIDSESVTTPKVDADLLLGSEIKLTGSIGASKFLASPTSYSGAPYFRSINDKDIDGYTALKNTVSSLDGTVSGLESDVSSLSSKVSSLSSRISSLGNSVSSSVTSLNNRIEILSGDISDLQNAMVSLNTSIADLSSRVSALESASGGVDNESGE